MIDYGRRKQLDISPPFFRGAPVAPLPASRPSSMSRWMDRQVMSLSAAAQCISPMPAQLQCASAFLSSEPSSPATARLVKPKLQANQLAASRWVKRPSLYYLSATTQKSQLRATGFTEAKTSSDPQGANQPTETDATMRPLANTSEKPEEDPTSRGGWNPPR